MNPDFMAGMASPASIGAVGSVGSVGSAGTPGAAGASPFLPPTGQVASMGEAGDSFGGWFAQQLAQVNGQLVAVDREMQGVALGSGQSLHQFMINMEEAKISFQLLAQVRNRLLESYQEVMRMQV